MPDIREIIAKHEAMLNAGGGPASPMNVVIPLGVIDPNGNPMAHQFNKMGLTKRDVFSAFALSGLLATSLELPLLKNESWLDAHVRLSVDAADRLLAALYPSAPEQPEVEEQKKESSILIAE